MNKEVDGVVWSCRLWGTNEAEGANLPDAISHAPWLDTIFDRRETHHTLLRHSGRVVVEDLLIRASFHTDSISATPLLVNEHYPILLTLVDGLSGARLQTGRICTVIADSRQVEEPHVVWKLEMITLDGERDVHFVLTTVRICVVEARRLPSDVFLALRGSLKDRLATVGIAVPMLWSEKFKFSNIPGQGVRTPRFGFDVVPQHVLLAVPGGPAGLARHRAGLTTNAFVRVENGGNLSDRSCLGVRIRHCAIQLPVHYFSHEFRPYRFSA